MSEHAEPGIDPDDLATTLRVLEQLHQLHADHPDVRTVKRAASYMYKRSRERRARQRAARLAARPRVIESTATGSAMRIDDETAGIPLVSTAGARSPAS